MRTIRYSEHWVFISMTVGVQALYPIDWHAVTNACIFSINNLFLFHCKVQFMLVNYTDRCTREIIETYKIISAKGAHVTVSISLTGSSHTCSRANKNEMLRAVFCSFLTCFPLINCCKFNAMLAFVFDETLVVHVMQGKKRSAADCIRMKFMVTECSLPHPCTTLLQQDHCAIFTVLYPKSFLLKCRGNVGGPFPDLTCFTT